MDGSGIGVTAAVVKAARKAKSWPLVFPPATVHVPPTTPGRPAEYRLTRVYAAPPGYGSAFATAVNDIKEGADVSGRVTRLADFGAFVEIAPGTDGLCHVSELSNQI